MKRLLSMVSMLGLALSLLVSEASANILYTFSGATFSDGGTLTGTFTTNDADTALLGFDVTTTQGTSLPGFHYTSGSANSSSTSLPFILVLNTPPADNDILQVTFSNLTAAGSPITIDPFGSFEQHLGVHRDIVAGSVIAVPEPSMYGMLAAGLALSGFIMMRRGRYRMG